MPSESDPQKPKIVKVFNLEWKLFLFALYLVTLVFVGAWTHSWRYLLYTHLAFSAIVALVHIGKQLLYILSAPFMPPFTLVTHLRVKRYLKRFPQAVPADVAIIVAHSDWTMLDAWIVPNVYVEEVRAVTEYLQSKGQNFSFYTNASLSDVEKIMADQRIREVYFMGHGTTHTFNLGTQEILYYCEFNDPKYAKDHVHQLHCGTPTGKSLVEYVVPEPNRKNCFLIRKGITSDRITKILKQKTSHPSSKCKENQS